MQVPLLLVVVGLLASSVSSGEPFHCTKLDPNLVYCPQVEKPRITELAPGSVIVTFTILSNGSVSGARVTQSDNPQWNAAVVQAVSHWRYKPSRHPVQKSQQFRLGFQA